MIKQQIIINDHDIKEANISRGALDTTIDIGGVSFVLIGNADWSLYMKLGLIFNKGEDDE